MIANSAKMGPRSTVGRARARWLGLPWGGRRFALAWRCAAQAGLGQYAPNATAADPEPLLGQERLETTCAVGTTALRKITLHFGLSLLIGSSLGRGRAV